jgi:hypothetical protein
MALRFNFPAIFGIRGSSAIMLPANQKANGSWSGARISALMALALSPNAAPQMFAKGHPRFFVREIHKG